MRPTPYSTTTTAIVAFLLGSLASPSSLMVAAANDNDKTPATTTSTACTASSTSGAFYDLRPDVAAKLPADGSKPAFHGVPTEDYHARGYDYGRNFTLNICDPVVEPPERVVGLKEELWRNVSAYYTAHGDVYSLGQQSGNLTARGKELVLQYVGGSPCGKKSSKRSHRRRGNAVHEGAAWRDYESDGDDDKDAVRVNGTEAGSSKVHDDNGGNYGEYKDDDDKYDRRKSATIFFSCDKDPVADFATASFIATDPEECHYVFKVKSQHACAGAEPHKPGSVGPASVFLIILGIAVLVYLLGGIFYNRTVSNARGWKQLPNYSLWASVWSFITVRFFSDPITAKEGVCGNVRW